MRALQHRTERSIVIEADRKTVFSFFESGDRWAAWWGNGSTIDPKPGGELTIHHSNNFVSVGKVVEIVPPERFVFTFSLQTDPPTPAEDSLVTIRLEDVPSGTRLYLTHELADAGVSALMVQGWRFHLSLFSNAVANELHRDAAELVDAWFALWAEPEAALRQATLEGIAAVEVRFRDRYSALEGVPDIVAHIGASQRFMPGLRPKRRGEIRHCQGTLLTDWAARDEAGAERTGTNVFRLGRDGRIESVTGFANSPAAASKGEVDQ